jgi:hypothetical protein
MEGPWGRAYNQEALHHFLDIERRRARLSGHSVALLLVDLAAGPGGGEASPSPQRLFAILGRCLRDTDVIGWYREGRVAAAVLTGPPGEAGIDAARVASGRVRAALAARLSAEVADRLRLRLLSPAPSENFECGRPGPREAGDPGRG